MAESEGGLNVTEHSIARHARTVSGAIVLGLTFFVVLGAAPRVASACTCSDGFVLSPRREIPVDGPIIVLLSSPLYRPITVELRDPSGAPVELRAPTEIGFPATLDGHGALVSFKPVAPLIEGEEYELEVVSGLLGSDEPFITGGGRAMAVAPGAPLPPPVIRGIDYVLQNNPNGSCGSSRYAALELEGVPEPEIVLIDRDGGASLDPAGPSGFVSAFGTSVGSSFCSDNWPDADYGATATVRAGTIDSSGRFSGWSDPVTLEFPEDPEAGCACRLQRTAGVPTSAGLFGALALLAGFCARRRGRSRTDHDPSERRSLGETSERLGGRFEGKRLRNDGRQLARLE